MSYRAIGWRQKPKQKKKTNLEHLSGGNGFLCASGDGLPRIRVFNEKCGSSNAHYVEHLEQFGRTAEASIYCKVNRSVDRYVDTCLLKEIPRKGLTSPTVNVYDY